jgi:hypothetical protein
MRKINSSRQNRMKFAIYIVLSVAFISVMAMSVKSKNLITDKNIKATTVVSANVKTSLTKEVETKERLNAADKKREEESKEAFIAAYKVFMHPRCMNCHPAGDVPLQGDDSHLHTQGVKRGMDGKGLFALKCKNCHQDADLKGDNLPPGHPNWHLPPANRKMVFEGKTPRQLAMGFKDPKFTGFNTMDKFLHHIEDDPLVKHSFTYGTPPPLSHEEFTAKVKEWIDKGAVVPDK